MAGNENETVPSMTRGPKFPQVAGEEDVEGHRDGGETEPDSMTRGPKFPQATGDDDVEGHRGGSDPDSMTRGPKFPQLDGDETPGPDGLK